MVWVKSVAGFRDFLSLVIVHAPHDFPEEDYLQPHEQLNLRSAYAELEHGLSLLEAESNKSDDIQELRRLLAESLASFEAGREIEGAHLLQTLELKAFGGIAR